MIYKMPEHFLEYFIIEEDSFFELGEKAPSILLQDQIGEREIQKRASELFRSFCGPQYELVFSRKWMPRIAKENVLVEDRSTYPEIVCKCFAVILAIEELITEQDEAFRGVPIIFPKTVFGRDKLSKDQIKCILSSIKREVFIIANEEPRYHSTDLQKNWHNRQQEDKDEDDYLMKLSHFMSRIRGSLSDDEDE